MAKQDKQLKPKQARFVAEYLKDSNATQAAIRAGYSSNTAGSQAHDLLKKPEIRGAVEKAQADIAHKCGITLEWVLTGVKFLAENAEEESVRLKAFELGGKHLKAWTDKVEATGENGGPLVVHVIKYAEDK